MFGPAASKPPYAPYADGATNAFYNLLFCDDPNAFGSRDGAAPAPWQATLFAEPPDPPALAALASDGRQEARVRYLAYARLRFLRQPVLPKQLLGVIVEVPLPRGLDVLAAYAEGGVRYINQAGRVVVVEAAQPLQPLVHDVFAAAAPVVARIGPWHSPRRPPPAHPHCRLTFLVSDGLYLGEGPLVAMQREPSAGPIIERAGALLHAVVGLAAG